MLSGHTLLTKSNAFDLFCKSDLTPNIGRQSWYDCLKKERFFFIKENEFDTKLEYLEKVNRLECKADIKNYLLSVLQSVKKQ